MNKAVHWSLSVAIIAAAALQTALGGGFQLNEHGARATAQASAFAARANDPSALFFNPAGISYLNGTQLMLGTTLIAPRYTFYGPYNLNSNETWEMNSNTFFPSNVYLTHTIDEGMFSGFAVGIGMTNPFGLGTEWDDQWVGKPITREALLETYYVMPTIAYRFHDIVAVGAGLNLVYGRVELRRAVTNFDPALNLELDGSGTGFSWNVGVMVKPVEDISIGFSYRAEAKVDYEGDATFNPPSSLQPRFPGGDVSTSITNPATFFAGIAWQATEDLQVEFDYQGVNWSSYDKLTVDFARDAQNDPTLSQADVTQEKKYENTFILRLGAEYALPVMGMKLRAGYMFDRNPVPDEHLEPILPDANRHGLSIGAGVDILPGATVDIAYMHLFFNDRETKATSVPGGVYFDGMYSGSVDLVGVNFTYTWN